MRILRVFLLACAVIAVWIVAVFAPVFLAVTMALRWSSGTSQETSPARQILAPTRATADRCPPILAEPSPTQVAPADQTLNDPVSLHVGKLADEQTVITALDQCGGWIRIQESPPQWLHLETGTLISLGAGDSSPNTANPATAR